MLSALTTTAGSSADGGRPGKTRNRELGSYHCVRCCPMGRECDLAGNGYAAARLGHGAAPDVRAQLRSRLPDGSGIKDLGAFGKLSSLRSSSDRSGIPNLPSGPTYRHARERSCDVPVILGSVRIRPELHIGSRSEMGLRPHAFDAVSHLDVARNHP